MATPFSTRALRTFATTLLTVVACGCAHDRAPLVGVAELPPVFAATPDVAAPVTDGWLDGWLGEWLDTQPSPGVRAFVDQALANNFDLAQQAALTDAARIRVSLARANRLPALNVAFGGQRGRAVAAAPVSNTVDLSATLTFEADIWGGLSDRQRAAELDYAAAELAYTDARRRLVGRTVGAVFDVISTQRLGALFDQRLENLAQSLDVIERGYRSGLNDALDVYLAQNTVEQERANVASQVQLRYEAGNRLRVLVAQYPDGGDDLGVNLPPLGDLPGAGVPADLLTRRSDVQQAWLGLLAADADLAAAHKDRFPSLSFSAGIRDSDSAVSRLLDGGVLPWTVAASLFQPVFQGGRLKALEAAAAAEVKRLEARYLAVVYDAFAEVENELQRGFTLADRLAAFEAARDNAQAALTLATDQYARGLVNYTTVLESQRRAFDAENSVIQLNNQLLQSRVTLFVALGGQF